MTAPCPVCGSERRRFRYRWSDGLAVHRCEGCGLLFTDPLPSADDLARTYREAAHDGHMRAFDDVERIQPVVQRAFERALAIVGEIRGAPPRSLLDVAGGSGLYARAAETLGLDTWYVEIDPRAAAFARERLGLRHVVCSDVRGLGERIDQKFDLVLARHCIEHLADPNAFVADLARSLAPGGVLLVETPNAENWEQWAHPRILSHHWKVLSRENPDWPLARRLLATLGKPLSAAAPPKHLYGFGRESLGVLLAAHGLAVRRVEITTCGDETFDPLYYRNPPVRSRSLLGKAYYLYERLASTPLRWWRRGSLLAVFAERPRENR